MHQMPGERQRFIARGPTVNQRQGQHRQRDESQPASKKSSAAKIALLAVHPERHMVELRKKCTE